MKIHNFAAGPAVMPKEVLEKAQNELINFQNTGISILETSHRSPPFLAVLATAKKNLTSLLNIPENYSILFMQGGATFQFSCIFLNLSAPKRRVDYLVTGTWSDKAAIEAERLGGIVHRVCDTNSTNHNGAIPSATKSTLNAKPDYVYYTSNETVHGVEIPDEKGSTWISDYLGSEYDNVPLICDASSNILSKELDIAKFGLIFFGAQKNIGPSGLTIVIARKDLLNPVDNIPIMASYANMAKHDSLYNTPPTFAIYMSNLNFEWLLQKGGIKGLKDKSVLVYDVLEKYKGFYQCCVVDSKFRSKMNITFRIRGGNKSLEDAFAKEAKDIGCIQIAGHRSVGGIRISCYNALEIESVRVVCAFMKDFAEKNK